jgi:hypothetical protein
MGLCIPFLQDASPLVTWESGDLSEGPMLLPTHYGTLTKLLLPESQCAHLYNGGVQLCEPLFRRSKWVWEKSAGDMGTVLEQRERERERGPRIRGNPHGRLGLPEPKGPSPLPIPSPATCSMGADRPTRTLCLSPIALEALTTYTEVHLDMAGCGGR